MKAKDIMTERVVTLAANTPVREIARVFRTLGINGAPVLENGRVIGIVTEIDLIARHARPHSPLYFPLLDAQIPLGGQREYRELMRHILGVTAKDIMTTPVITVDAEADLEEVATLMVESKANPLPVLSNGKMVGIISHTDILPILEEYQEPAGEQGTGSA